MNFDLDEADETQKRIDLMIDQIIVPESAEREGSALIALILAIASPEDDERYALALHAANTAFQKTETYNQAFREFADKVIAKASKTVDSPLGGFGDQKVRNSSEPQSNDDDYEWVAHLPKSVGRRRVLDLVESIQLLRQVVKEYELQVQQNIEALYHTLFDSFSADEIRMAESAAKRDVFADESAGRRSRRRDSGGAE